MKIILIVLLAACCAACTTLPPGVGGATFCSVAKPIYWSPSDTRATKEQIDTHDRVGKALCGWGKK